ncbi:MAG: nuclear transport factor 2 family protein [Chitinophagaceae bacterium]|nr:MAG: nuclear transport factor 2 family protein [Chitinophagaceae bacterium]
MSVNHKEILLSGNAAIAMGDHEGFLALCTDNTQWDFIGDQLLNGKQAVRDYMAATYTEPPVVTVDQLISEGDFLTVVGEITLKDQDGKARDYAYCDVWRFRDGKMAELKAFVVERKSK